jgi:hypothetical protein
MPKRGEILVENIIFIVLNVLFLTILIIFLINQGNGVSTLEDAYSKEVALLIDSARPGMIMTVNMQSAMSVADKNNIPFDKVVSIKGQYVTVTLDANQSKSYQFFNDINVSGHYPERDSSGKFDGFYILAFSKKT